MFDTAIQIRLVGPWSGPKIVCKDRTLWRMKNDDHIIYSCLIGKNVGLVRAEPKPNSFVALGEYPKNVRKPPRNET